MLGSGRKKRKEALARLAPVVSGAISKDERLRGTYRGYDVEAWTLKQDPTPTSRSSDSSPDEVVFLGLQLGGVKGRGPWGCVSTPRLNPFAAPEYKFELSFGGLGPLAGFLGAIADVPPPDPELEGRLRAAGLVEAIDELGRGSSAFLPRARYAPAPQSKLAPELAELMQRRLPAAAVPRDGMLLCELELGGDTDPSPQRFSELLELALRIAEINAAANPL